MSENQKIVTTMHDLERVFQIMQQNNIQELSIEGLVIKARQIFPFSGLSEGEKGKTPVSDEDILRNPYAGLQS